MAKIHFRSYNPNQIVLFPQRIDENIPSDDPVRILNAMVDSFDLSSFHKLYKESGRSAYHPRMMLKAVLYAYMNNIYSCRKIEKSLLRDIHFIWLAGYEKPDYRTIMVNNYVLYCSHNTYNLKCYLETDRQKWLNDVN